MRDSEKPTGRFAHKEYMSEPAKKPFADIAAREKDKKAAAVPLVAQEV